jgi:hypothetical protein
MMTSFPGVHPDRADPTTGTTAIFTAAQYGNTDIVRYNGYQTLVPQLRYVQSLTTLKQLKSQVPG